MPSKRIDGARLESIASPLHRACRGRLLKMNPSTRLRRRNPNDVNMSRWLGRLMCQLLRAEGDLSSETKRARHSWPEPFQRQAQIGMLSGQDLELGDLTSLVSSMAPSGFTCSSSSLYAIGVAQIVSPQRVDDKDGHYVLAVGENLTARYKINRKMGEGTFGQVLECWDCEKKEIVAVNIVRAVDKYHEAAMIEIDVLLQLKKQKMTLSGWQEIFWVTLLPPVIILAVGTKLQGIPLVYLGGEHFWFRRPQLVLNLIHFTLFQNAFQITYFFRIWYDYRGDCRNIIQQID